MGRMFILIGMLFAIIDIPLFVFAITGIESEWFAAIVEPIVCNGEEEFRAVSGYKGAVNMSCEVGEKTRTVTSKVIGGLIVLFLTSFVLSMIFAFMGRRMTGNQQANFYGNMLRSFTVRTNEPVVSDMRGDKPKRGVMPLEVASVMQTVLDSLNMNMGDFQQQSLTERLRQLQDAYNQGLLTQEEYERVRTSIIDKLDD